MENKINYRDIIKNQTGFVSQTNKYVYNIDDLRRCMLEISEKILELAAEKSFTNKYNNKTDEYNNQSILDLIKQVE